MAAIRHGQWGPGSRAVGLAVVALLAAGLAGCTSDGDGIRDAAGEVVATGTWSVFDLREGDCLDPAPDAAGEVAEIPVVPCDQPHAQEVFATVELAEGPYPGAEAVAQQADGECLGDLESSLGLTLADGLFVSYLLPTFTGWNRDDDRRVVCVLVFPDREDATGSVVAGTADVEPLPVVDTTDTGSA